MRTSEAPLIAAASSSSPCTCSKELFAALTRGYEEVYGFAVLEEDVGYLLDTLASRFGYNVRALVKAMVEILDLMRLNPERSLRHFLAHG